MIVLEKIEVNGKDNDKLAHKTKVVFNFQEISSIDVVTWILSSTWGWSSMLSRSKAPVSKSPDWRAIVAPASTLAPAFILQLLFSFYYFFYSCVNNPPQYSSQVFWDIFVESREQLGK